jgi:exodeoxyribonuclease VII large subunit
VHDVLAVWRRRYPRLQVTLIPTAVQGAEAEPQILAALAKAENLQPDVILLTRGGGSLEDLWCFNLESVARAIYALTTPVVSAIGHEIDVTIADFVADLRAPTPSAAAELMVPDANDLSDNVDALYRHLRNLTRNQLRHQSLLLHNTALQLVSPQTHIQQNWQRLDDLRRRATAAADGTVRTLESQLGKTEGRLHLQGPTPRLQLARQQLAAAQQLLQNRCQQRLNQYQTRLANLVRMLEGVSPLPTLARGYAIVRSTEGRVIESADALNAGDRVTAQFAKGTVTAVVENIDPMASLQSGNLYPNE